MKRQEPNIQEKHDFSSGAALITEAPEASKSRKQKGLKQSRLFYSII